MKKKPAFKEITNSCDGKIRYNTAEEANKFVTNLNKQKSGRRMKSYYCIKCNGHHYGRQKQKKMKRNLENQYVPTVNLNHVPKVLRGEFYVRQNY